MRKKLLKKVMVLLLFLGGSIMYAQTTVTGVVSDATGPLPGVNVFVKGTTIGAQTDFDGIYTLENVPAGSVIVYSFLGYSTQEITVGSQTTINVTLQEDTAELDEIVIIGYGQTTVKDATGAVASVKAEDFNQGVIASPEQLIQGKTAGIQIAQTSGEPGAGINIRIRGTASIRSNNNPLFVVDGVPLGGNSTSAGQQDLGFGDRGAGNPLNFINPNDIESISVLKDASSTAIYGSRGANGVVIITTKSGKGAFGESVEYNSNVSISSIRDDYNLLNRDRFLTAVAQFGGDAEAADAGFNTNWQDYIFRDAITINQNFAYSNNYESGNIRATVSYGDQKGVVKGSGLERFTVRLNAQHRLFEDKLKLGIQTTYSYENNRGPGLSSSAGYRGDLIGSAYSANPTWPTDPDYFDPGGLASPAAFATYVKNRTYVNRVLLNGYAEYDVTPELKAKVNVGYDESNSDRNIAASPLARNLADDIFGAGRAYLGVVNNTNHLLEMTLNYNKEFGNSKLDVLVGYSFQDFKNSGKNVLARGFDVTAIPDMYRTVNRASEIVEASISGSYQQYGIAPNGNFVNRLFPTPSSETIATPRGLGVSSIYGDFFNTTDEIQSQFARVNYTLADKYLFTATIRRDGSSRFSEDNRHGYFPSGAIAWKINEEDFMGDSFSTLKLRLQAGITGNQDGLDYGSYIRRERYAAPEIERGGNINQPGLESVTYANPDLKWEETVSYGVGIDFGFANDRLSGSIDVYRKETNDLLLSVTAAQPSPQPFFFQNLDATVLNQGIEFAISYGIVEQEDFTWDASFNMSYNENELQNFAGQIQAGTIYGQGLSNAYAQILAGGHPLFSYFLREFEGFDANGQPIGDVQTFVGKSALPDFVGGFSTNIRYKNWDFSAYLAGQYGAYIYNNTRNAFFVAGAIAGQRNVTEDVLTSGEAGNAEAAVSTRFLENGDFLRLQNMSIGYNFDLKETSKLKTLRVSLTGQNLFVITPYSGPDPEVSTQGAEPLNELPTSGIDYVSYPNPRTFTFGLFAKF
ncbi:SusC/RagA family TonB-linked outer membrane protein [Aestuariivivens sediminicola]|uniref:SusC/RagA family TonB-linked outer membrane protein n=1 Tax=Aestuariivivens sediminicola TaxID=2913560 RepID=UPI001F59F41A|nr:TonB-dependent receptor [Aestuariivivens sediminicola]